MTGATTAAARGAEGMHHAPAPLLPSIMPSLQPPRGGKREHDGAAGFSSERSCGRGKRRGSQQIGAFYVGWDLLGKRKGEMGCRASEKGLPGGKEGRGRSPEPSCPCSS